MYVYSMCLYVDMIGYTVCVYIYIVNAHCIYKKSLDSFYLVAMKYPSKEFGEMSYPP